MNAHLATADHLQAQAVAHLHNAISGYQVRDQMHRCEVELRGIHEQLRAAQQEAALLSTDRPVFAELAVQQPAHSPAEMEALLADEGDRYPEIRAELVRAAVNAIGWVEAIDRASAVQGVAS